MPHDPPNLRVLPAVPPPPIHANGRSDSPMIDLPGARPVEPGDEPTARLAIVRRPVPGWAGPPAGLAWRSEAFGFFGLAVLGLVAAVVCDAALTWDGAGYLFEILDQRQPFISNFRLVNVVLHAPVLVAALMTGDVAALRTVFGGVYALIPLAALGASWWVTHRRAPHLFIWAVFGICLVTLPGQMLFVFEAITAVQLFWPLLLIVIQGAERRHWLLATGLSAAILVSHPTAPIIFAILAGATFVTRRARPTRRQAYLLALAFAVLSVLAAAKFFVLQSTFEQNVLTLDTFRYAARTALLGLPLTALVLGVCAALLVFAERHLRSSAARRLAYPLAVAAASAAVLVLLVWASDGRLWRFELGYRLFALLGSLPFILLAILEATRDEGRLSDAVEEHEVVGHRLRLAQILAAGFSVVLAVQSITWHDTTGRLARDLAASPWSCASATSEAWLADTPLDYWTVPALSMLLQGRAPSKVMLAGDGCSQESFEGGVRMNPWYVRPWSGRWFDLGVLQQGIAADQQTPTGCWSMLTSGWYGTERLGPDAWWRWSGGRGAIRVMVERDMNVVLTGRLESIQRPATVTVLQDGQQVGTIAVTWDGMQPFPAIPLTLKRGENTIELVSDATPSTPPGDTRLLALAAGNVEIDTRDASMTCLPRF